MLADGAYQISSLQTEQRELLREEQALGEQLELLGSTQNLTANAEALGMVASGNPLFLNVATGGVSGVGLASRRRAARRTWSANSLLDGSPVIDPAALAAAQAAEAASGDTGGSDVVRRRDSGHPDHAPGTLPSPTTH